MTIVIVCFLAMVHITTSNNFKGLGMTASKGTNGITGESDCSCIQLDDAVYVLTCCACYCI